MIRVGNVVYCRAQFARMLLLVDQTLELNASLKGESCIIAVRESSYLHPGEELAKHVKRPK